MPPVEEGQLYVKQANVNVRVSLRFKMGLIKDVGSSIRGAPIGVATADSIQNEVNRA